jgi:hypothetical protein
MEVQDCIPQTDPAPNPYEVPIGQEIDFPQERIVAVFFRLFVLAQSAAGVVS